MQPAPRPTRRALLLAPPALLVAACSTDSNGSDAPAGEDLDDLGESPAAPEGAEPAMFDEPWRPQFHYSPQQGPMADPNGLVWFDDEWHLFHQQEGTWAHAVSSDLIHWEHLPTALAHDELGQALSGSVVVDSANTSGLFDGAAGLVALYTSTEGGEAQSLAFSSDRGRTWTRHPDNPVVPNDGRRDFRDPKVFWHEPTGRWVMVVAADDRVELFGSPDLLAWEPLSEFGPGHGDHSAVWECPDLFELDDDTGGTRWVLTISVGASPANGGSSAQYFIGDFDGTTFTPDPEIAPDDVAVTDVGQDFYAAQSFDAAPNGRRIWLAWMGNWDYPYAAPTDGWTNAMSLPRTLELRRVAERLRLVQAPVVEVDSLREDDPFTLSDTDLEGDLTTDFTGTTFEFDLVLDPGDATEVGIRVRQQSEDDGTLIHATTAALDRSSGTFVLDRSIGGMDAQVRAEEERGEPAEVPAQRREAAYAGDGEVRIRGFVDEASLEVFVDDGALSGTLVIYPPAEADGLALYAVGGTAHVRSLTVHRLASIWT